MAWPSARVELTLALLPQVLNKFSHGLGLGADSGFAFCDVYGLDPELLAMVPQPALALLLLFPITEATEADRTAQAASGPAGAAAGGEGQAPVWYTRQTIGNACGTIGVLHALANARSALQIEAGSFLERFLAATEALSPEERAAYLEHPPPGAPSLEEAHQGAAAEGSTAPPPADATVDLHFVCFVHKAGSLFELDGRKTAPVCHGSSSEATFLQDAVGVVRDKFVALAGDGNLNFNLMAFAKEWA